MKRIVALLMAVISVVILSSCSKDTISGEVITNDNGEIVNIDDNQPTVINPLTGEDGYNSDAVGKRPVSIVVENQQNARPQWGIESPDIIAEGEVEGGITRMLWIYADFTSVPDKIGPVRSARPPFVKFSELFDSVFIHWGGSESREGYVGGYDVISNDLVPDIDGMDGGALFGRDETRSVSSEHRGIVIGNKIPSAIADKGYRTDVNNDYYPEFKFNDNASNVGSTTATTVNITFSRSSEDRTFSYSEGKYHTSDWEQDVEFENIVVLLAPTEYITTSYYSDSITYINYSFESGDGYIISNGTSSYIGWSGSSGTLQLFDENGNDLSLNKGKTYIALASSNNKGNVNIS